ncbi:Rab-like protein 5 [Spironucleus salmonicida]|uniref:Rab-like protein 5 n=1 Tax=Spironucleus salmonicida TaxID=348837 RepID=V6LJU0_9EUKA|nr:Rab-like protein 5 [Spironucleus salmonicida]|eukprot:EST43986.1 Rab-like protein 5 [Spironucleus salmonicida]
MTVRIGFVGPSNCGKTVIAEYYAELVTDPNFADYHPTQGLRIIETERKVALHEGDEQRTIPVQIWDISGDPQYEPYYSRLSLQLDGVVIIVPANEASLTSTVKKYYSLVVDEERVGKPGFVMVFFHKPFQPAQEDVYVEDKNLAAIPVHRTSMEVERQQIDEVLDQLVARIGQKNENDADYI